jgi:hypothetical protein
MSHKFIEPNYINPYPAAFSDYRSVVNRTGTLAIFERAPVTGYDTTGNFQLYSVDLTTGTNGTVSGSNLQPFLSGQTLPQQAMRPDLSWLSIGAYAGSVSFSWIESNELTIGVVGSSGADPRQLNNTVDMEYPTWIPNGNLAVDNSGENASPSPNTSIIQSTDGTLVAQALAGSRLWAGMPSVNQVNPDLVAFAGQIVSNSGPYQQDYNYIWVVDQSKGPTSAAPMENGCPSSGPFDPSFQGRAPWWSPDGKWIVFESNRACPPPANNGEGMYAIFLYEVGGSGSAIQLTDPKYNMNHAKWFPFGFPGFPGGYPTLIVAAFQPVGMGNPPAWPYGLASLDVSSFVQSRPQSARGPGIAVPASRSR